MWVQSVVGSLRTIVDTWEHMGGEVLQICESQTIKDCKDYYQHLEGTQKQTVSHDLKNNKTLLILKAVLLI